MLSESSLWIMACGPPEDLACVPPECVPRSSPWQGTRRASAATATHTVACSTHCSSAVPRGHSPEKTVRSKDRPSQPGPAAIQDRGPFDRASPEVEVPRQGVSAGDGAPFLGTASCKLICQNYSDLCIRGDQVLPLSSENAEDHLPGANAKTAVAPFLWSCDIDPEPEDAERSFQAGQFLLRRRAGSHQWRQGSGRDLSILFHGRDGPATYSLWNCFLEHKLMHLARDQAGAPCPLLASEFIHTSVDQLTQQLSRERRLEAGLARDMLIGCMLRVASDVQSGEISTPLLQFSEDTATPRAEEALGEEEPDEAAAQRGQDFG